MGKCFSIITSSPQSSHDIERNYYGHFTEEETESRRICLPVPGAEQRRGLRVSVSQQLPTAFPLARVCHRVVVFVLLFVCLYIFSNKHVLL